LLALGSLESELDRELVTRIGVIGKRAVVARVDREIEPAGCPIAVPALDRVSVREKQGNVVWVGVREVEFRAVFVPAGVRLSDS
jgi:hypothetical protein